MQKCLCAQRSADEQVDGRGHLQTHVAGTSLQEVQAREWEWIQQVPLIDTPQKWNIHFSGASLA